MTEKSFKELLTDKGIKASEFSKITGTPYSTVMKWTRGERRIPAIAIWSVRWAAYEKSLLISQATHLIKYDLKL